MRQLLNIPDETDKQLSPVFQTVSWFLMTDWLRAVIIG